MSSGPPAVVCRQVFQLSVACAPLAARTKESILEHSALKSRPCHPICGRSLECRILLRNYHNIFFVAQKFFFC